MGLGAAWHCYLLRSVGMGGASAGDVPGADGGDCFVVCASFRLIFESGAAMTRGMILNNPMNLMESSINWVGQMKPTSDPEHFLAEFISIADGLRAGMLNLAAKQVKHGLNTWGKIIPVYAPPSQNDSVAYTSFICKETGVGPEQVIDLTDVAFLNKATAAIIRMEKGSDAVSVEDIRRMAWVITEPVRRARAAEAALPPQKAATA